MSARRILAAILLAGAAVLSAAAPARAQDSIVVRVGGELAAPAGQYVDVPVTVDLAAAPGRALGAYQLTLRFDPQVLQFNTYMSGGFAAPSVNTDSAVSTGRLLLAAVQPSGATGSVTLFTVQFYVATDTVVSAVTVTVDAMAATAASVTPFEDLLPLVRVVDGNFCASLGKWGDVDGDSASNSRDALMALSDVVGLPPAPGANPALADVDGDAAVTSRDALIILSYAVGLPVAGFRVMQTAAGPACATGSATTLAISADTLELVSRQEAMVAVTATDATGRAVPLTGLTWRSLDPAVAVYDPYNGVIAHGAGTTRLIAELGPGVADTLVVTVLARRSTWYVDVRTARNVVTQTGSMRHPMEFIGDALDQAADGDTVRVAGGIYEEVIYENGANVILGDSLDRPVIDPRGAPYFDPYYDPALTLDGGAGTQVLAHLRFANAGAYIRGGDVTVHHVEFDSAGYYALWIHSLPDYANPAPGLGPLGNVLVDSVTVGYFRTYGVYVEEADTVEVRRTRTSGDLAGGEGCSYGSNSADGNIVLAEVAFGWVHDNVADGGPCQGIGVYASAGRAVIQRNLVRNLSLSGILARARHVALDHNAVRTMGRDPFQSWWDTRLGIGIPMDPCYYCANPVVADSVVSVADTVVDVFGGYVTGFSVDTAKVVVIDQLLADSIGPDSAYDARSVHFFGERLTLTGSRILRSGGVGLYATGKLDLFSRDNRWDDADRAIVVDQAYDRPDTVLIVGDSVTAVRQGGIDVRNANVVRVDSVYVDGTASAEGVHLEYDADAMVARSRIQNMGMGVFGQLMGMMRLVDDTIQASAGNGVRVTSGGVDTVYITRGVIAASAFSGLDFDGVAARVDSAVISGNLVGGVAVGPGGGLLMRHSRVESNGVGIHLFAGAAPLSVVRGSRIAGNTLQQGARNDNYPSSTLDADSVWWGAATGPSCDSILVGFPCVGSAADSVLTLGVTFANFLTAVPPTPVPPALRPAASRLTVAPPVSRPASARIPPPERRQRAQAAPQPRRSPLETIPRRTWQRGREPRPPTPRHDR